MTMSGDCHIHSDIAQGDKDIYNNNNSIVNDDMAITMEGAFGDSDNQCDKDENESENGGFCDD